MSHAAGGCCATFSRVIDALRLDNVLVTEQRPFDLIVGG
jgi:hypothetical protein